MMQPVHIKEVILHHTTVSLIAPFTTSFGTMTDKDVCLVEVIDESGVSGWGETVTSNEPYYNEETTATAVYMLKEFFIPRLLKQEFSHPNVVHDMLSFVRRNNIAKASIETAIWDVFAKKNHTSIAELLGGTQTEIPVGKSIGIQDTPALLVEKVRTFVDEGFKKIKVKIKPGADLEYLNAVRKAFPDIPLMADANSAYTLDDIDHLKKLDALNLMMIEQPLSHDDIVDHRILQQELTTPVCLDESVHSLDDARKAIELGSCQIINIKIGRVGGLYESKRIHDLCLEKGIAVWCGGMLETGIGRAHNIQLTTLKNFTIPGDTAPSAHYWKEDIVTPEIVMDHGIIHVPSGDGIGYEVDREKLGKVLISSERITEADTTHPIPSA